MLKRNFRSPVYCLTYMKTCSYVCTIYDVDMENSHSIRSLFIYIYINNNIRVIVGIFCGEKNRRNLS